jgi:malate dehydrogenase (oxaloacetate-decarboxylating)
MAAVTNALRVVGKSIDQVKVVFSGAGAAGIACAQMLMKAGVRDMILVDSKGSIYDGREDLTHAKRDIAKVTNREGVTGDIHVAIEGADVFIGLSGPDLLDRTDIAKMAKDSVVLAMANPTPEILPDEAKAGGAAVIGTGRSDFPNQVNNVLAFPGVFKGAMESRAPRVTAEMQLSAALALANLIENPSVENILPNALDKTVAPAIAAAVSKAYKDFGAK